MYNFKGYISDENIARKLNRDKELEELAISTYVPYPEDEAWTDEYKESYRKLVKEKKAVGYGIIPNALIRYKISNIILEKMDIQNKQDLNKQAIFDKAKEMGEPQLLGKYVVDCNNPNEDCNTDIIYEYAMPDGTIKRERVHTY